MIHITPLCFSGHLGAVFRTVLETMRTLFVWLVDLALFYGGFGLGESWTIYSWIQAAGFVVLVCGTLVYQKGDETDSQLVRVETVHACTASYTCIDIHFLF